MSASGPGGKARKGVPAFRALHAAGGGAAAVAAADAPQPGGAGEGRRWRRWGKSAVGRLLFDLRLVLLHLRFGRRNAAALRRIRPLPRPIRCLRLVSPLAHGGVAKVAVQTLLQLDPGAVHTHLFVFGRKQPVPAALAELPGLTLTRQRLRFTISQYFWGVFGQIDELAGVIRRERPDILHLHEPTFAVPVLIAAGRAGGCPVLVHLHSLYTGRREGVGRLQRWLERRALRSTPLIACSETIRANTEHWLGATRRPIFVLPDGADDVPAGPPPEGLRQDLLRAAGDRRVVVQLARLIALKRIDDFLAAGRRLLDAGYPVFVLLVSYGTEEEERTMRGRFDALFGPEEGEFLFQVQGAQHLLPHAAIGVSASSLEGLGLNVLEFQMAGVPVVCTDLPAHREMVEDGVTGLLYRVGDVDGLVRRMGQLLDDPALGARLTAAARLTASRYRWDLSARRTEEHYRSLLAGAGGRR